VTQGQVICYKVGPMPFMANEVTRALGGNTRIELSAAQTTQIVGDQNLRDILRGASGSFGNGSWGPGSVITDPNGQKYVPNHVTGVEDSGTFQNRTYGGQYQVR
jgi:hypothetical protein